MVGFFTQQFSQHIIAFFVIHESNGLRSENLLTNNSAILVTSMKTKQQWENSHKKLLNTEF